MRPLVFAALLAALAPWVSAQRQSLSGAYHRPVRTPAIFFYDPFYSDALYREGYAVTSQPPVIVLQTASAVAPVPDHPSVPTQPLMIELQGDRYVRISGEETSTAEMKQIDPTAQNRAPVSRRSGAPSTISAHSASQDLAPAILVFRDGRRQEVSEYTIVDGILYTHADYYTDGTWTKKIALSSLNLLDTINANESRGIKFQLPTAPNEVIVRP